MIKEAMNEPQSIDDVLSTFLAVCMNNYQNVLEASVEDDEKKRELLAEPLVKSKAEAKAAIEAMIRDILGNYDGNDLVLRSNLRQQRLRASKYNLKLEKE